VAGRGRSRPLALCWRTEGVDMGGVGCWGRNQPLALFWGAEGVDGAGAGRGRPLTPVVIAVGWWRAVWGRSRPSRSVVERRQ